MTRYFNDPFEAMDALFNLHRPKSAEFPPADIYTTDNQLVFEMALAGYSKDDIEISIVDSTLTIGSKEKEVVHIEDDNTMEEAKKRYFEQRLAKRNFMRKWTLGPMINQESIEAEMKDGILKVTLAMKQPATKLIDIK